MPVDEFPFVASDGASESFDGPPLTRGRVPHACVAAFAAASGRLLKLEGILLEDLPLSLLPDLNVFNMPPRFSGLGVRETFLPVLLAPARLEFGGIPDVICDAILGFSKGSTASELLVVV